MPPKVGKTRSGKTYQNENIDLIFDGYDAKCETEEGRIRRELYRSWHLVYQRDVSKMSTAMGIPERKVRYKIWYYRVNQSWDLKVAEPPAQDSNKWWIYKFYNRCIEQHHEFPFVFDIKSSLENIDIFYTTTRIKHYLVQEGVTFKLSSKNTNATGLVACSRRARAAKQQLEIMTDDVDQDQDIFFYDQSGINQEVLRLRMKASPAGVKTYDGNKTKSRTETVTLHYVMNSRGVCIYHEFTQGGTDGRLIARILKDARSKVSKEIIDPILISDNLGAQPPG
jgi:hypothetical protein